MLSANIDSARIAHGQLFIGDSASGSLSLALSYVQYLYCTDRKNGDSCGECANCYKVSRLQHPDLHLVFPHNKSKLVDSDKPTCDIYVDIFRSSVIANNGYLTPSKWIEDLQLVGARTQPIINVRDAAALTEKISLKSYSGGYKCVIVWQADTMNVECANKLLKLLEEPPSQTLFILISDNSDAILPTIFSRLQSIHIPPIDSKSIKDYVLSLDDIDQSNVNDLVKASRGSLAMLEDAIDNLDFDMAELDPDVVPEEPLTIFRLFCDLMRNSFLQRYIELMSWSDRVAQMQIDQIEQLLVYSVEMIRNTYAKNIGMEAINFTVGKEALFLNKFHPFIHHQNIEPLLAEFERAHRELLRNGNKKIVITHFALSVSKLIKLPK